MLKLFLVIFSKCEQLDKMISNNLTHQIRITDITSCNIISYFLVIVTFQSLQKGCL